MSMGGRFEIVIKGREYTAWKDFDGMILGIDVRSPTGRGEPVVLWKRGQLHPLASSPAGRAIKVMGIGCLIDTKQPPPGSPLHGSTISRTRSPNQA
jgi:hypothetical protein